MIKTLITLSLLITFCSCAASLYKAETAKTAKAAAASQRINSSQENSREILKDLD